ncbi:cation-translocating P-type ATPase [Aeromicrobium camelliae]|uniref:Cation-translocating P-type ATPase n=1 Tax=Aeromicrobium camelliae TaxID=1538144 RepID=A0A3N6ZRG0_9ACTN|nr:HAD family hydrolase [Aeromicrobium camelliae]RQN09657.1 cation-translocating P-type ATPase [Aeromicrobium camelliae]
MNHRLIWVAAAAIVLAVWWILDGPLWALVAAVGTLVVTAPAAFDLGARSAERSLLRAARKRGLELPADPRIDHLVMDKQGYLTTGTLRVASVEPVRADYDRDMRWFAGALEHHSDHPVGKALARLATRGRVTDVVHHRDAGISGVVDKHPVRVGRPDWIGVPDPGRLGTTVGVEVDERPLGTITLVDTVAPHAADGVAQLRELGITAVLATTDSARNAEHLADIVGIDRCFASTTPEQAKAALHADGRRADVLPAPAAPSDLRLVAEAYALARDLPARIHRSRRAALVVSIAAGLVVASSPALAVFPAR